MYVVLKFLKSQDFKNTFQKNLICIFLSFRANLKKKTVCHDWPCSLSQFFLVTGFFWANERKYFTHIPNVRANKVATYLFLMELFCTFLIVWLQWPPIWPWQPDSLSAHPTCLFCLKQKDLSIQQNERWQCVGCLKINHRKFNEMFIYSEKAINNFS